MKPNRSPDPANAGDSRDRQSDENVSRKAVPAETIPQKKAKPANVLGEAGCLRALSQLPGLIVMGAVTSSQANAMRGAYQAILSTYARRGNAPEQEQASEQLMELVKANPRLLNSLQHLLTDAQVAAFTQLIKEDHVG